MKKYYAFFPRNFGNEYSLYSVENEDDQKAIDKLYERYNPCESSLHRVTVKEMREWAAQERRALKHNPSFAGYCDLEPQPARYIGQEYGI